MICPNHTIQESCRQRVDCLRLGNCYIPVGGYLPLSDCEQRKIILQHRRFPHAFSSFQYQTTLEILSSFNPSLLSNDSWCPSIVRKYAYQLFNPPFYFKHHCFIYNISPSIFLLLLRQSQIHNGF